MPPFLIWVLVLALLVGIALAIWPCEPTMKKVIISIVLILFVLALLDFFHVFASWPGYRHYGS
jgi:hypothetical protein